MIRIRLNDGSGRFDLELNGAKQLQDFVTLQLDTDGEAQADDPVPPGHDRGGYWGDAYPDLQGFKIGSRLWLLQGSKATPDTLTRAQVYIQEALAALVTLKIASAVNVTVERISDNLLWAEVSIQQPAEVAPRFLGMWEIALSELTT